MHIYALQPLGDIKGVYSSLDINLTIKAIVAFYCDDHITKFQPTLSCKNPDSTEGTTKHFCCRSRLEKLYWGCEANRWDRKRRNTFFLPLFRAPAFAKQGGGGAATGRGGKWGRGGLSRLLQATVGHQGEATRPPPPLDQWPSSNPRPPTLPFLLSWVNWLAGACYPPTMIDAVDTIGKKTSWL